MGGGGCPEWVLAGQSPYKHEFLIRNNIYDFFFFNFEKRKSEGGVRFW